MKFNQVAALIVTCLGIVSMISLVTTGAPMWRIALNLVFYALLVYSNLKRSGWAMIGATVLLVVIFLAPSGTSRSSDVSDEPTIEMKL